MTAPQKPAPRTIRFDLKAPYEGFYVEARADFPARTLADLSSGDFAKAMTAFELNIRIVGYAVRSVGR